MKDDVYQFMKAAGKHSDNTPLTGKDVYGPYYDEAVDLYKTKPDWFSNPDESIIVQGDDLAKARADYRSLVRKGELEKGHHIQGLWSGC
ncbi:hypothetical protein QUF88_12945 [Bacillus sp. DX1.1]|uniref:hypothetical protein n=1 Tax=unclassified Bacillus (in: firmicutes) TaxID=185979 RepID=UPI00257068E8|nr:MULTISPECIES: hypothetical protein [unclassified Bacillus (in: firmicutes)]MDM5154706.1 hypothetical protein [Bacillus sp. DX1.1]WJE83594.1 hypothetical protein QRE67_10440 [Bacillus sp. DX3.1]